VKLKSVKCAQTSLCQTCSWILYQLKTCDGGPTDPHIKCIAVIQPSGQAWITVSKCCLNYNLIITSSNLDHNATFWWHESTMFIHFKPVYGNMSNVSSFCGFLENCYRFAFPSEWKPSYWDKTVAAVDVFVSSCANICFLWLNLRSGHGEHWGHLCGADLWPHHRCVCGHYGVCVVDSALGRDWWGMPPYLPSPTPQTHPSRFPWHPANPFD